MDIDTLRAWPWVLTGLQVLALWTAGRGRRIGWLLGGTVQFPWIVYALLTDQIGFIPGCAVSAFVQLHNYAAAGPPIEASRFTAWVRLVGRGSTAQLLATRRRRRPASR
jgi:hypothetical protein